MKKLAAIGSELSTEVLADVHGGRFLPWVPGHSIPEIIGRAAGRAASSVGNAVSSAAKSAWDTVSSWF